LLVDDEHELASVAKEWLEDMGYTVSTAPNAIVALEMLKTRHWDVLLSDIVMPGGMDGLELAEKVAALYPRMKILLSSGYAERSFRQDAVKWRVLAKPFRKNDLSIAIRAALSEKM
jgi:CheY-like chemotaxis protein